MMSVDPRSLVTRVSPVVRGALESAAGACLARGHYEVTPHHLLHQLLEAARGDVQEVVRQTLGDAAPLLRQSQRELERMRGGNPGKPVLSPLLLDWLRDAWLLGSVELGHGTIRGGTLLAVALADPLRYLHPEMTALLEPIGAERLRRSFRDLTLASSEEEGPAAAPAPAGSGVPGGGSALERFTTDHTRNAREGRVDPIFGRDLEIRQVIDILARRRKNNPICVGDPGVGKTALAEGLALRIVRGDVPALLRDVQLLGLDLGLLQAGAGVKGEFENRVKQVIEEVRASARPIVLFIDEAHSLIGAGNAAGGADAANLLKPALARGDLRTVAATTWSEYRRYFERDPALARRFQLVRLEEPSVETSVEILRGLRPRYEEAHGVTIADEAVVAAVKMAHRYISGRLLPDKAVDLLDTCAARVKVGLTSKPGPVEAAERAIGKLERELAAARRDAAASLGADPAREEAIDGELRGRRDALRALEERWAQERAATEQILAVRTRLDEALRAGGERAADVAALRGEMDAARASKARTEDGGALVVPEVRAESVAQVVSDWTGIPTGRMLRDDAQTALQVERLLGERIKGQPRAIEAVAQGIRAAYAGIRDPDAPIGVFLLVGSSGTGKTETALAVADLLFGGERMLTVVNMGEFQERHTVSKLIGSPPGYVGYGEGGILTEAVRQRPYSAVLLDEIEKADLEVMNLFYSVFDKGELTDGEGRRINFRNTVLFLTTNLGTDVVMRCCGEGRRPSSEELAAALRPTLSKALKPALLARMTVVPYLTLPAEVLADVARMKLARLARRVRDAHGAELVVTDALVDAVVRRCSDPDSGARNVDHVLRGTVMPRVATAVLERMTGGPLPPRAVLDVDASGDPALTWGGA